MIAEVTHLATHTSAVTQSGVLSQEDFPHTTLANLLDYFVMENGRSDHDALSIAVGVIV